MTYSKERAVSIPKNNVKFIPAGIVTDVVIKSVKLDTSPNGRPFIELTFEKDGATTKHTEYKPMLDMYTTTEEALQVKVDNQYSRMLQILCCYYSIDELNLDGKDFNEFAQRIVDALDKADKTKKLRVKFVYNKNGFTDLPTYVRHTFIEPMELPEGKTSEIVALNIDQFTKPIVADKEDKNSNPIDPTTPETNTQEDDDLPF